MEEQIIANVNQSNYLQQQINDLQKQVLEQINKEFQYNVHIFYSMQMKLIQDKIIIKLLLSQISNLHLNPTSKHTLLEYLLNIRRGNCQFCQTCYFCQFKLDEDLMEEATKKLKQLIVN